MRQPRFEVVGADAGWHARFRAANGQVVWVTESYTRRRAAVKAMQIILFCCADGTYSMDVPDLDERTRP